MSKEEFNNNNIDTPDFGAGFELMDALKESGVLTESRYNIIKNISMITEARTNTPTSYVYLDRLISWEVFKAVYTDYDRYESIEDVWKGLGYPRDLFSTDGKVADENMSKQLRRIVAHFQRNNGDANDILVNPSARLKAYSSRFKSARSEDDEDIWDQPPTREDIDPGRRGRVSQATRAVEKINSQELLSGEFYSDFSRIPPSRWGSWLRFWERDKTAVKQNKRLFGRTWKKTFVLGYQLQKNLVYEIWYASLDSSFALYDSRGNQVSRSFATLSEATKALINAIVQSSSEDADFFSHGGMNNAVATSLLRTMTGGLDQHIEDMKRLETKEQADITAAREAAEKKKAIADAEKEKSRAKAEANRKANWEYFKTDVKQAGKRVFRDFGTVTEKFGVPAADSVLDKFRKGAVGLDQFLQNVADSLDLVGSTEERDLRGALKDDEIDLDDYIAGIRELAAKKRADKTAQQNADRQKKNPPPQATNTTAKPAPKKPSGATKADAHPTSSQGLAKYVQKKVDQKINDERATGAKNPLKEEFTFEQFVDNVEYMDAQEQSVTSALTGDHQATIRQLRNDAYKGSYTQQALKAAVNTGLVSVYTETRVERNFPATILPRWINKGRREPIVLPTDKPGIINRLKMLIKGVRFQADFIVGFSLADRINIEIWYITEPNPENSLSAFGATDSFSAKPAVSSFYIFDVTSGTLLRKYVPYYRNAVQIAMAKLSAQ